MHLIALVTLTMTAFAANSVLNRIGVASYGMDPLAFAVIRTGAGAAMLAVLVAMRTQAGFVTWQVKRLWGALALAAYMIGFSWAYLTLGAGLGALILFGVLQVVVFGWAVIERQSIPPWRWVGAGVAMVGLIILLWPAGDAAVPVVGALSMVTAGVAWAIYTLLGRGEPDALGATAGNFIICLPLVLPFWFVPVDAGLSMGGVSTAIIAGAVTSGMGYALWYRCLPQIATVTAAIAQLSVPVIAVVAGVILLSEPLTWRLIVSGVLVLGGILISLKRQRTSGSSGS